MKDDVSPSMHCNRVNGLELAMQVDGAGRAMVWGHNLLGSMEADTDFQLLDWRRLAENNLLVRYDARGHGDSQGEVEASAYVWPQLALDMLEIAAQISPGHKVVLAGASMGCATALHAACQQPDRVAGLILLLPPTGWRTRPKQARIYTRMARLAGFLRSVSYLMYEVLPLKSRGKEPKRALGVAVAKQLAHANKDYIRAALLGAAESDMPTMSDIEKLNIPTLILAWQDDDAHPVSSSDRLAELLPDVRGYHVSSQTEVLQWTGIVEKFLAAL